MQDDEADEDPAFALPTGTKNYITPQGFKRLQDELKHLLRVERPKIVEVVSWAAGNGDRSENGDYIYGKKRLREIDRRVRFLTKRLAIAEAVDPARQQHLDFVLFGATVTYVDAEDKEATVTLVGVDETDAEAGKVSWICPIARAFWKRKVGDEVVLRSPGGAQKLEILEIRYLIPSETAGQHDTQGE
ncbi:transcription elongation factor GreB [Lacibacterium aquatile]|uniref:Transcription elongation factor GreB n=1 Tax=Lacibacterium aquatile TaxID=1168082 RepID=A0ABW5DVM5_9PROT